jgi:hypothetical protein
MRVSNICVSLVHFRIINLYDFDHIITELTSGNLLEKGECYLYSF